MLAGLDAAGVVGLGITGGGLRHPIGVERPLVELDDFTGQPFYVFRYPTGDETLVALGAIPTGGTTDDRDRGLQDGTIGGYEQSVAFHSEFAGLAPYVTANVALWPATAVFIAGPDGLAGLSEAARAWLDEAVASTVARSIALAVPSDELIDGICRAGGRFATASDESLAAMRDAVEPVLAELAEDEITAGFIAEIEALKTAIDPSPLTVPDGCSGPAPGREAAVAQGTDDPSVLNGSYRVEWTPEELLEALLTAGAPDDPDVERDSRNNAGAFVVTFADGAFDSYLEHDPTDNCPGTYGVSGDRVTMVASSEPTEWHCGAESLGDLYLTPRGISPTVSCSCPTSSSPISPASAGGTRYTSPSR